MEEWGPWTEINDSEDNLHALLALVDDVSWGGAKEEDLLDTIFGEEDTKKTAKADTGDGVLASLSSSAFRIKKRTAQDRQREELRYLRAQARELEYHLSVLASRSPPPAEEEKMDEPQPLTALWETFARQQYEQRHQSESENYRLREQVHQQFKIAKSLERVLKRQSNVQLVGVKPEPKRICLGRDAGDAVNAECEDEMLDALLILHEQLDLAFVDPRFDTVQSEFRDVQVCVDELGNTSFEFLSARIVPFDVDTTGTVLWKFFCSMDGMQMRDDDNIVCSKPLEHGTGEMFQEFIDKADTLFVGRRYVEDDRVVILSVATMNLDEAFGKQVKGIVARHRAWRVVQRPRNQTAFAPDAVAAQVQFHQIVTIEKHGGIPNCTDTGETLEEYTLRMLSTKFTDGQQTIENMLFECAREKQH